MPDNRKNQPHHVLILGCGRSGTSIFGEFFQHLSPYQYFSEPPYAALKQIDFSTPTAIKVPAVSREFPPTEGLSFPLADLLKTIPQPLTVFWQVRHPLDAICSLKVGISKNWGHHPRPLDWKNWLDQPLIKQCAHHWNYLNKVGFEKVADLIHLSKFEEAILNTINFADWVCELVNVDAEEETGNIEEWCARVQNTNNSKFVEAETSRAYSTKDHRVKVGRWKENMTKKDLEMVIPMIKDTALKFGYDLSSNFPLLDKLQ